MNNECPGCALCRPASDQDVLDGDCTGCPVCSPGVELEGQGALTVTGQGKLSIEAALSGQGDIAPNGE